MTCAFAVRGALKKFPGVDSVDVSLNKGLATVKLQPGNTVWAEQFWEAVKKNGFTPKETHVMVRGEIQQAGGKIQLKVNGTSRSYELVSHSQFPKAIEDATRFAGKTLIIEGTLTPAKDLTAPVTLHVQSVRQ